ncbi:MAG: M23 family metallopeptidase, partial [Sulfolobales archaeon]
FHRGIDIAKPYGTPIPAILEGGIKEISYDGDGGWYIKVSSVNREFGYFHIFSGNRNNIPQQLNNWKLTNVELRKVNEDGSVEISTGIAIILWLDRKNNIASKVLVPSEDDGREVYLDRDGNKIAVKSEDNKNIKSQGFVSTQEYIAPVGNSGISGGPHLHVSLKINDKIVNPLFDLKYEEKPFEIKIESPPHDEYIFSSNNVGSYLIDVVVNSENTKDLDEVNFYIYKDCNPSNSMKISNFCYGGRYIAVKEVHLLFQHQQLIHQV